MKRFGEIRVQFTKELTEETSPADPPVMLVLRRKAIRQFAGGERVALYGNDKSGIEVSIPYKAGKFGQKVAMAVKEEEEISEQAIHTLHHLAKTKQSGDVRFPNGGSSKVDSQTAHSIMSLYGKLTPQNRKFIERHVNSSPEGIKKVADFVKDNVDTGKK